MQSKVLFIGGGNMAASLIGGLIADGQQPDSLFVVEPSASRREWLREEFRISCNADAASFNEAVDVIVLAVKPQVMAQATRAWQAYVQSHRPVVLSIAAGIRTRDLSRWLGDYGALIRAMPNTPSLIQAGACGLYACPEVDEEGRGKAEAILRAVGITLWVDKEELIDAITALSGSGPAYFFLFMEALQEAGVSLGLPEREARLLTLQTALGAARMALESHEAIDALRERVTSPGGTTEQALNQFNSEDLKGTVKRAVDAAAQRATVLADELGNH